MRRHVRNELQDDRTMRVDPAVYRERHTPVGHVSVATRPSNSEAGRFALRGDQHRVTRSRCRQALTSRDRADPRCSANSASAGVVAETQDQPLDDREKRGDLDLDHAPNDLEIHTEIVVN